MKNLANRFLPPIAVLVFGIIMLIVGSSTMSQVKNFPEVSAIVTSAEKEDVYDSADDTHRVEITAYVSYTVDGKSYNELLNNASTSLETGDEITVRYNPDDPSYVTGASKGTATLVVVLGIILTIGGLIFLAYKFITGR